MINAQLAATTTSSSSSILQNTYVTRGRGWRNPWRSTDLSRGSFRFVRDFPETSRWSLGEVADVSGKSRTSLRQVRGFPETSPTCLGEVSGKSWTSRGSSCNGIWPLPSSLVGWLTRIINLSVGWLNMRINWLKAWIRSLNCQLTGWLVEKGLLIYSLVDWMCELVDWKCKMVNWFHEKISWFEKFEFWRFWPPIGASYKYIICITFDKYLGTLLGL